MRIVIITFESNYKPTSNISLFEKRNKIVCNSTNSGKKEKERESNNSSSRTREELTETDTLFCETTVLVSS